MNTQIIGRNGHGSRSRAPPSSVGRATSMNPAPPLFARENLKTKYTRSADDTKLRDALRDETGSGAVIPSLHSVVTVPSCSNLPLLVEEVGEEGRESLRLDLSLLSQAVQVQFEGEKLLHCDHVRRQPRKPHLDNQHTKARRTKSIKYMRNPCRVKP